MRTFLTSVALLIAASATAKTYKYDQFPADLSAAAAAVQGQPLATQPGFAKGEAFGQFYRPDPGDYPIQITGIDLILAAPPGAPTLSTHAVIEVWLTSGDGPSPGKSSPDFSISTADLFNPNTGTAGVPLVGNTAISLSFDMQDPDGHPPVIKSGNFLVMVRFTEDAKSMATEWGTAQCMAVPGLSCGCQNVGTLHDQTSTPKANVLNYIEPMGQCSGNTTGWAWMNNVGITGDIIMRVQATTGGGCTPSCNGKECGDDGCGGSCGECGGGKACKDGKCAEACTPDCLDKECGEDGCGGVCGSCPAGKTCGPLGKCVTTGQPGGFALSGISPDFGYEGEATPVTIFGAGFMEGIQARLGTVNLTDVVVVSELKLTAVVPNLFAPGKYTLSVLNPDGASATLVDAFEVRKKETAPDFAPEAGSDVLTGDAAGEPPEPKVVTIKDSGCTAGAGLGWPVSLLLLLGLSVIRKGRK